MYTFGAPRVGLQPFAANVDKLTKAGGGKYVFRIANLNDPVTTVPPGSILEEATYPYVHVGGAWQLQDAGPKKMADEPPLVNPLLATKVFWGVQEHSTSLLSASRMCPPVNERVQ